MHKKKCDVEFRNTDDAEECDPLCVLSGQPVLDYSPDKKATFSFRIGKTSIAFISSLRRNPGKQNHISETG